LHDRLPQLEQLLVCLVHVEPAPNPAGEFQHGAGETKFCLFERGHGHPLAERHVEGIEKPDDDGELEVRAGAGQWEEHAGVEQRVLEKTRLHQVGLRNAELRIRGLKIAVVQQRDLDGVVSGQAPFEQRPEPIARLLVQLDAAVPMNPHRRAFLDRGAQLGKASVRVHRRAAREADEQAQPQRGGQVSHRAASCTFSTAMIARFCRSIVNRMLSPGLSPSRSDGGSIR
jgi:hypothetical protein